MAEYTINKIKLPNGDICKLAGPGSGVSDVQVNGTSVVSGSIANIPLADTTTAGVVSTEDYQRFWGVKQFDGGLIVSNVGKMDSSNPSAMPTIGFYARTTDNETPKQTGSINFTSVQTAGTGHYNVGRMQFAQRSHDSTTGEILDYGELYRLPTVADDMTANANYELLSTKKTVTIAQGGTGQTGQTAQQSWTPNITIAANAASVSSVAAYYKRWGMAILLGGRFNLTTSATGALTISLPSGLTVPTSATQVMGMLIDPTQKAYHIRIISSGLTAYTNGGSGITLPTGYYNFWAIVFSV